VGQRIKIISIDLDKLEKYDLGRDKRIYKGDNRMEQIKYKRVNKCVCCNRQTMLFIWTTSRPFIPYKEKLSKLLAHTQKIKPEKEVLEAVEFGLVVCQECFDKLKHGGCIYAY